MRIFRLGLAASTALGLSMTAAVAGDNNEIFLEQNGQGNVADVVQSTGGLGGNQIGTSGAPALQQGDNNLFLYSDEGCCNANSRGNNDITRAVQVGNENTMSFRDWNIARNNTTGLAQQIGNDNDMRVGHNGGESNVIGDVLQVGNDNHIRIDQNGDGGAIYSASITGSGNGGSSHSSWHENWGILIQQGGTNNTVVDASIVGDDNDGFPGSRATAMRINQTGDGSTARGLMLSSNGSFMLIDQGGTGGHSAEVEQGTSVASTGNYADVDQNGQGQTASVGQYGDNNYITVSQNGAGNTLTAGFYGDGNGVGTMTGVAGDLVDADLGDDLFQGNVFQDNGGIGAGNSISYTVNGSNNLFAFAQMGAANSISGNVGTSGASNGNQVAVLQAGSGNGTSFTQNGGNNNLAVSQ